MRSMRRRKRTAARSCVSTALSRLARCCAAGAVATLALLSGACDDTDLRVTVSADAGVTSEAEPVTLEVTAENLGGERVEWGRGSSSCQLGAVARTPDGFRPVADIRACTEDLVPQGLDPGGRRVESWLWDGGVRNAANERVRLAPGTYEVRGAAGDLAFSSPIQIEVR